MIEVECITNSRGDKDWYIKGTEIHHREDGPAIEYVNGDKSWWQHDKLHRLNGPAIEHVNGYKQWWIQDKRIFVETQKDFERYVKLMAFE